MGNDHHYYQALVASTVASTATSQAHTADFAQRPSLHHCSGSTTRQNSSSTIAQRPRRPFRQPQHLRLQHILVVGIVSTFDFPKAVEGLVPIPPEISHKRQKRQFRVLRRF